MSAPNMSLSIGFSPKTAGNDLQPPALLGELWRFLGILVVLSVQKHTSRCANQWTGPQSTIGADYVKLQASADDFATRASSIIVAVLKPELELKF